MEKQNKQPFTFVIGQTASTKRVATSAVVEQLAAVSQDNNPVHLDDDYAKETVFGQRIAHGLFCLGMISALLGMKLPGEGGILISECVQYRKPVYIDDEIEATVEVTEVKQEKQKLTVAFCCVNQRGETVLDGQAEMKVV